MSSMLEVLITIIGVILILAFATQALQEVIKAAAGLKGGARMTALRSLITQAAAAQGLDEAAARDIVAKLVERLRGLGQAGVRNGAVRLDRIEASHLAGLINSIPQSAVTALKTEAEDVARKRLEEVAEQATAWFELAMSPVNDRHTRRMRGWSLLTSAVVVLSLNASAFQILDLAQTDPEFRSAMVAGAEEVRQLDSLSAAMSARVRTDTLPTAQADSAARVARQDSLAVVRDSISRRVDELTQGFLAARMGPREWGSASWWLGILLSILLVAMGAPFWNDLLGSVLGVKNWLGARPAQSS